MYLLTCPNRVLSNDQVKGVHQRLGLVLLLTVWAVSVLWAQSPGLPPPELITDRRGLPQAFVPAIVQDKQGFIWMATRDGLARYDGNRFKVFQPDPDGGPSLSSADVAQIKMDHHGKLWIANEQGELDVFDPVTEQFTNLTKNPAYNRLKSPDSRIRPICIDRRDQVWMMLEEGLLCFDLRTRRPRLYRHQPTNPQSISQNSVINVLEGSNGMIWVLTRVGLDGIDERTHAIRRYLRQPGAETTFKGLWVRPSGEVLVTTDQGLYVVRPRTGQVRQYALPAPVQAEGFSHFAEDRQGNVYFTRNTEIFRFTDQQGVRLLEAGNQQPSSAYLSTFIDRSDVLWLGTVGAGVRKYDLRTNAFQYVRYRTGFAADLIRDWLGLPADVVPAIDPRLTSYNFRYTFDGQGRLWYNCGSSDLFRLDRNAEKADLFRFPTAFFSDIIGEKTCPLATDPGGRVWAVYNQTAYWFDEQHAQWRAFPHPIPLPPGNTLQMVTVDEQALWLATSASGLLRIDRATGQARAYQTKRGNTRSLSSNALLCLATDPDDPNLLWIGTYGSGLCRLNKKNGLTRRLLLADGLPNQVIYSVIPDRYGDLWVGTNKGLGRIDRRTLRIQTYTTEDGLGADEFNRFHFLYLPVPVRPGRNAGRGPAEPPASRSGWTADERIIMGGLEGITAFYPRQIQPDSFQPRVEMTTLYVNNKPAPPGPNSPLGALPIQAINELILPYDQNFLTVEFAGLQFNKPAKNQYRYQLVGLDPGWVASRRPEAVFTGLQPGHYRLRLNAANTDGRWSPYVRTLGLTLTPPWWASWWAYALYALMAGGLLVGLVRVYTNRLQLQQSVRLRQQETEQLREANALKTRFFANITHEFRTPLTLILAPTEQLMSEQPEPRNQRRLRTIEQNAHQLLRLINQLLDLSRLEAHVMPLHESRGDLTRCVAHWLQPLTEQATTQTIDLTLYSEVTGSHWFDIEKFERIVYNLTANALKFTKAGTIRVSLADIPQGITLTVADTGIGIPARDLPHIFDRFYQVGQGGGTIVTGNPGTGIGLALVHELVLLQKGRITVDSQVNTGTTFVVELPYRKAAAVENPVERIRTDPIDTNGLSDETDEPRVLIVEDNDELAHFIAESLPASYHIRRAVDGRDGLEQALEQVPDLVISDVMMPVPAWRVPSGTIQSGPEMDGFALCRELKADLRTSHIPVILLTAKVTVENRLEGLAQGADEYLTKPFHVAELQLRVHNLLEQHRRQREWIRRQLTQADQPLTPQPLPDDPFLLRLYALLDTHLSNPDLSVDTLVDGLAMSRSSLHRKVKALTSLSTAELIRNYRLKAATALLRQGHTSTETADMVGFDSPSYFARCFRDLYGVAPSEFSKLPR